MGINELSKMLDRIKQDIASKQGEKKAAMADLEKNFGLKNLDDAYDKLDEMEKEIADKKEEKEKLLTDVERKLKEYGY